MAWLTTREDLTFDLVKPSMNVLRRSMKWFGNLTFSSHGEIVKWFMVHHGSNNYIRMILMIYAWCWPKYKSWKCPLSRCEAYLKYCEANSLHDEIMTSKSGELSLNLWTRNGWSDSEEIHFKTVSVIKCGCRLHGQIRYVELDMISSTVTLVRYHNWKRKFAQIGDGFFQNKTTGMIRLRIDGWTLRASHVFGNCELFSVRISYLTGRSSHHLGS